MPTIVSPDLLNIVPRPAEVVASSGQLLFASHSPTTVEPHAEGAKRAALFLRKQLGATGKSSRASSSPIRFQASSSILGNEEYVLTVATTGITIQASTPAGWFYGVQSFLQMLPASSFTTVELPCVQITDKPRFAWRGLMLDVARHIMPVDGIFRLLDNMAAYKLNIFHWHLTDDQGWRIESRRYPLLTEVGAWRAGADGTLTPSRATQILAKLGCYGGFYTQDEIRQVVAYAAERHIEVIPEIEMPAHALAALAAYPEISCAGGPFEPSTKMGIFNDVYCVGNEATFDLLQDVLDEILPLFPSRYVHIGGDECPKDRWKTCPKCQARIKDEGLIDEHGLQSYMIRRMQKFLAAYGKRLIGWDEILEGGLAPGATVMSWRGTQGGIAAARGGHDVVMTPHTHCYLDYRQAENGEPVAIEDGLLPLEKTYGYDPVPAELTPEQAGHILGLQGNVWTEYMPDMRHVEYMIWPRAAAIAEIGWTNAEERNFEDFCLRMKAREAGLAASGSAYRALDVFAL